MSKAKKFKKKANNKTQIWSYTYHKKIQYINKYEKNVPKTSLNHKKLNIYCYKKYKKFTDNKKFLTYTVLSSSVLY